MEQIIVALVVLFVIFIPAIVFIIILFSLYQRKKEFVETHSIAIKEIKQLNNKYYFYKIDTIEISHSYDNINFYNDIDPIDYLTYQVAHELNFYKSRLNCSLENMQRYNMYMTELKSIQTFGIYDIEINVEDKKKYDDMETKLFNKYIKSIPDIIKVDVILYLTNINGDRKERKSQTFNAKAIDNLIKMISQKRGTYYLNSQIWNSISRVERGKVSNKLRFYIYNRDNNRCVYCGSKYNLEVDHIIPISKGGKSTPDNLQTLCKRCNYEKSDNIYY